MKNWKITGLIATIIIVLSLPTYLVLKYTNNKADNNPSVAQFVGRENCIDCHKKEYDLWRGSHHDKAMAVASDSTVLADFNNTEITFKKITSRFYKKENKFFVFTEGPQGKMAEFEITHTFGVTPLQQYLVPFPDGRYQCLPIAWDSEKNKWFHLVPTVYPDEEIDADNWLHWTNLGQNWNGMCAECHSTNLQKNYDFEKGTFNTTWTDIDVSCEACHGPGSLHLDWAKLPEMSRPMDNNTGLVVQTSNIEPKVQVEICAPCHSRRSSLGINQHNNKNLMDYAIPQLLSEPIYFSDGQILEEDYVYGSFIQSKMYMNNIRCGDCHDAHSGKLVKQGNALCLQCHKVEIYDSYNHHFHKKEGEKGKPLLLDTGTKKVKVGEGALCVNCHMPGRYYMGNDFRNDHSMRIPRPDLTTKIGTPNACNQCHTDKSSKWAEEWNTKWYGISRKPHFGEVFARAGNLEIEAVQDLIRIVKDELYPPIVRATALELLYPYPMEKTRTIFQFALNDVEPLLRHYAVRYLPTQNQQELIKELAPLLDDQSKAVRIWAAQRLSIIPEEQLNQRQRITYKKALREYIKSQEYAADFTSARHNLGLLYSNLGRTEEAARNYEASIKIDNLFYPAKVNLALVYNKLGQNKKAVNLYKEIISEQPDFYDAYYSLGLLLAEEKDYKQSVKYLQIAAKKIPQNARIHYNLGLLLQFLKRVDEAEISLLNALKQEPDNLDFMYALTDFYIKSGQIDKAKSRAQQMVNKYPDVPISNEVMNYLNSIK